MPPLKVNPKAMAEGAAKAMSGLDYSVWINTAKANRNRVGETLDYSKWLDPKKKALMKTVTASIKTATIPSWLLPTLAAAAVPTALYGGYQAIRPRTWQEKLKSSLKEFGGDVKEYLPAALSALPMQMAMSRMDQPQDQIGMQQAMPTERVQPQMQIDPRMLMAQQHMQQYLPQFNM